ncbi:16S rRNA (cytosine(1402)-N(4))-methyltransferase RsmH [Candidatus Hydrogenedentota bacterium]
MNTRRYHREVLADEVIRYLAPRRGGVYVDCTAGGGGHSSEILKAVDGDATLIGLDRDPEAIAESGRRLSAYERVFLVNTSFLRLRDVLCEHDISHVDGILMDLGVSSHQMDEAERGFSFQKEGPLDMRMDQRRGEKAADLVNTASREELVRILREFGEEREAGRIVGAIVRARTEAPIEKTQQLRDIVVGAKRPVYGARRRVDPATKTFQALRIAVNDELTALEEGLAQAIGVLAKGGRICVISFHSLEDRIVKRRFAAGRKGCVCPADFPVCQCGRKPELDVLTGRPVRPTEEELAENPRARSSRLRAAEKI